MSTPITESLQHHAEEIKTQTLTTLLADENHCNANLLTLGPHITLDYSRQHFTQTTLDLLLQRAEEAKLDEKIKAMANGDLINNTEGRAVLHMALRENPQIPRIPITTDPSRLVKPDHVFKFDGEATGPQVQAVLDQIEVFSEKVRNGSYLTPTGKEFTTFIIVGIGGSYLGTQFIAESLKLDKVNGGYDAQQGKTLRFISNVDPMDFHRAVEGIDYERTMVIVISKTFTTAETMMNAKLMQNWLLTQYSTHNPSIPIPEIISKHFIACSTAVEKATAFGIGVENIFPFWNWVGGRFSVTSCVGILPLSLYFGYPLVQQFLAGCHDMDKHFMTAPLKENLPVLLGLIGLWNSQYLNRPSRCIIPYQESLASFVTHIQQVDMESNGKRVGVDGEVLGHTTGEVDFGTPGSNSQHSYFQLLHQSSQIVPIDFSGFIQPQCKEEGAGITSHDELMCNFFFYLDAFALGSDGNGNPHKIMPGNKPSSILLMSGLTFYTVGMLLSLYEHRTAVQGFMWNLNSFDQFGVELGKVLANKVRGYMTDAKSGEEKEGAKFVGNTQRLLKMYMEGKM